MSEEAKPGAQTTEQQGGGVAPPQVAEGDSPPAAEDVPAWRKALDEAPAEELRSHPKFAGVLGSELEARRLQWEKDQDNAARQRANEQAQQALDELAQRDPDAFADRYLKDRLTQKQRDQLEQTGAEQTRLIGRLVGAAMREVPGWDELQPSDHEAIFQAVADAEKQAVTTGADARGAAISAFNRAAVARLATLHAAKQHGTWREADLKKERAALEEQMKLEKLQQGGRPDVGRVRGDGAISDEPDWKTDEVGWNAWFLRQQRARTRSLA